MIRPASVVDLARFGPAATSQPPTLAGARAYCRQLAREHYENFSVSHFLLPRELRQHFCNLYAYCRWADDLADEIAEDEESLRMLDWWESQVNQLYEGTDFSRTPSASEGAAAPALARGGSGLINPLVKALAETVHEFTLPPGQ
ncbi:MAG: squalene/phytoene synthase family protein, partial [Pirellulaceae bacterium]|nr:squalene/phytoene synthase family protein [Pirellulaceae bacterium]